MSYTFRNGLTEEQVKNAKKILLFVSVKDICAKLNIKVSTIYNVSRDNSSKISDLKKVLDEAYIEIEERKRTLAAIPSTLIFP